MTLRAAVRLALRRSRLGVAIVGAAGFACVVACQAERRVPAAEPVTAGSKPVARPPATETPAAQHAPSDRSAEASKDAPAPVRDDGTMYASTELMGTRVSINVFIGADADTPTRAKAEASIRAAFEAMVHVDRVMSEWKADSALTQLNRSAGGEGLVIPADLFTVLRRAKEIAKATDGHFDPTFHGVGKLWSFRPGARPPAAEAVKTAVRFVDYEKLELDADTKRARLPTAGMAVGLGAIAKGWAVDKASEKLRELGFVDHIVEAGGDTFVSGRKGQDPWRVGVQRPGAPGAVAAIELQNEAIVTSGDYQRFFEYEGKTYAHILDPRTGFPVPADRSPRSVSVVAKDATDADAYCTAIAVMGVVEGLNFANRTPGIEAVILTADGQRKVSKGLTHRLIEPPAPPPPPPETPPSTPIRRP